MRRIEFRVENHLPPKKDGANSMWAKSAEVPRLIALRNAALLAMNGEPPLSSNVELELEVHFPMRPGQRSGDLDNFITGICDGLMLADSRIKPDTRWDDPKCANIHPFVFAVIEDDDAVISIVAQKVIGGATTWYRVTLQSE